MAYSLLNTQLKNRGGNFDFIVIGCGRGGTSLLAGLLDAHPHLDMAFEWHAADYLMAELIDKKEDKLEYRLQMFEEACIKLANESGLIWGNKITSEHIFSLYQLSGDSWLQAFNRKLLRNRKLIYIVRDGRTCVRSKIQRTDQAYELARDRWKFSIELLKLFQQSYSPMLWLKFEDLVRDPEMEMKKVCDFLEIDFKKKMLKGTSNRKMNKIYQRTHFDQSVLSLDGITENWTRDMGPELEYLKYL